MPPTSRAAALLVLSLLACGGDGSRETASATTTATDASTSVTTTSTGSGTTGDVTPTGSATGPAGTSTGAPATSTGPGPTTTAPLDPTTTASSTTESSSTTLPPSTSTGAESCNKVDFLFVIDSSISMEPEQTALKAAFPAFIDTIQSTLEAQDYHIMVIDTDAAGRCTKAECAKGDAKHETCNNHACNAMFTECDTVLGAGVLHPAGQASSNKLCTVFGDNRYIVMGEPTLAETFACVATVGLAGSGQERPMDAMAAALAPAINADGGCNAGFLRDDAILVITMITDDPNVEDMISPADAHAAVVAAKGGDEDSAVVLGLIPDPAAGCPGNMPEAGKHWAEFIGLFGPRGITASVCEPDYNAFFQDAVAIINETCILNPIPG